MKSRSRKNHKLKCFKDINKRTSLNTRRVKTSDRKNVQRIETSRDSNKIYNKRTVSETSTKTRKPKSFRSFRNIQKNESLLRLKKNDFILLMVLFITLFMCLVYAEISGITLNISSNVQAATQEGVFITNIEKVNLNSESKINYYLGSMYESSVVLQNDPSASESFEITVYNKTNVDQVFITAITDTLDDMLYDNENIEFVLTGLEEYQTTVAPGQYLTFTITYKYKDGADTTNNVLNNKINFRFMEKPIIELSNEGEKYEKISVIMGSVVEYEFTVKNNNETHINGVPMTYTLTPIVTEESPLEVGIYNLEGELITGEINLPGDGTSVEHKYVLKIEYKLTDNNIEYEEKDLLCNVKLNAKPIDTKYLNYEVIKEFSVEIERAKYEIKFHPNTESLPVEYQELEYIESDGTQYIDTGYKPNSNSGVEATFQFTDFIEQDRLFGTGSDTAVSDLFDFEFYINKNLYYSTAFSDEEGTWLSSDISADTNKHTLYFNVKNDKTYKIGDTTQKVEEFLSGTHTMTSSNYNLTVFARNYYYKDKTRITCHGKIKLYDFKIFEDSVLIMNFVPCYEVSTGRAGLYDTIGKKFYSNENSDTDFYRDGKTYFQEVEYGMTQELYENTFSREGYEFVGWNTKPDGSGESYSNREKIIDLVDENNDGIHLYAMWNKNSYVIKYHPNKIRTQYKEVEYIESTGTQYIDTNYIITGNTGVEVEFEYTDLTVQQRVFGSTYYQFYINGTSQFAYSFNNPNLWKSTNQKVNKQKHILEFNKDAGKIKIDNGNLLDAKLSGSITESPTNTLTIMATNGESNFGKLKIYSFKIYENGELVRSFVPCYRISDNVVGLYEILERTFHPSVGTGMLKGEDKITSQIMTVDELEKLNPNPYTNEEFSFVGWNTESDATGKYYYDEELVNLSNTVDQTINLYAQWKRNYKDGVLRPSDDPANTGIEITTTFGTIEVIWLKDRTNVVTEDPNPPEMYTHLGVEKQMTPVTWTYHEDGVEVDGAVVNWTEDETPNLDNWYNYRTDYGTDGRIDNVTSMWANAKNSDGSYFVWIPRYAYRITYYSDADRKNVQGFYDGYGKWRLEDGKKQYDLDPGVEYVDHNGKRYIVHPVFIDDTGKVDSDGNALEDFSRGGWDLNLTGFWVGKYEASRANATATSAGSGTTVKTTPGVLCAVGSTAGHYLTYSLSYDTEKESHMVKMSEWGAVAYLAESQFGRNAHEVSVANSYIAGNASDPTADASGIAYNTIEGAKVSTTGNVYGVYGMSGGRWEYVAGYNRKAEPLRLTNNNYAGRFASQCKDAEGNYISTKYATAYDNASQDNISAILLPQICKVGDGTKEVMSVSIHNEEAAYWYSDFSRITAYTVPVWGRGGASGYGDAAGLFYSDSTNGGVVSSVVSFRMALGE